MKQAPSHDEPLSGRLDILQYYTRDGSAQLVSTRLSSVQHRTGDEVERSHFGPTRSLTVSNTNRFSENKGRPDSAWMRTEPTHFGTMSTRVDSHRKNIESKPARMNSELEPVRQGE